MGYRVGLRLRELAPTALGFWRDSGIKAPMFVPFLSKFNTRITCTALLISVLSHTKSLYLRRHRNSLILNAGRFVRMRTS